MKAWMIFLAPLIIVVFPILIPVIVAVTLIMLAPRMAERAQMAMVEAERRSRR